MIKLQVSRGANSSAVLSLVILPSRPPEAARAPGLIGVSEGAYWGGMHTNYSIMANYPRGMFLYDEGLVMVRYERNTMVLPRETYEERGYEPKIADLPSRGDWLKQFTLDGEYVDPQKP